jgi:hypothetical protein
MLSILMQAELEHVLFCIQQNTKPFGGGKS